jgi:hypothetical protein
MLATLPASDEVLGERRVGQGEHAGEDRGEDKARVGADRNDYERLPEDEKPQHSHVPP